MSKNSKWNEVYVGDRRRNITHETRAERVLKLKDLKTTHRLLDSIYYHLSCQLKLDSYPTHHKCPTRLPYVSHSSWSFHYFPGLPYRPRAIPGIPFLGPVPFRAYPFRAPCQSFHIHIITYQYIQSRYSPWLTCHSTPFQVSRTLHSSLMRAKHPCVNHVLSKFLFNHITSVIIHYPLSIGTKVLPRWKMS